MSNITSLDADQDAAGVLAAAETCPLDSHALDARRALLLGVVTAGFVVLFDWLFWNHLRGWTIGAYGLALMLALLIWEGSVPRHRTTLLLTVAITLLCLQCVEEPSWLVVAYGLLALFTLALVLRVGWIGNAFVWMRRWTLLAGASWLTFFRDLAATYRRRRANLEAGRSASNYLAHWLFAILLGAVFVALFAAANPVLAKWLGDAWQAINRVLSNLPDYLPSGWHALTWVAVGLVVWALLRYRSPADAATSTNAGGAGTFWIGLPPALVVRCLIVFNLLFALQTGLDIYYLLAGGDLPAGLTHGEYARRGAYPLLAATILAAFFVLAAFRAGPREHTMRHARRLVYVWLIQNLFLVLAAASRLRLYVEAYTLTRWRVAAAIWMLLVFCGIVWILLRILTDRTNLWLVNVNAVTAALVLYACCFINFDGLIARYNVAHCREMRGSGPKIDLAYLESLGPETLPALQHLTATIDPSPTTVDAQATIDRLRTNLRADLTSWRGWTWRRERLLRSE